MVVLLASGGYDQTIRLWDAASGMCTKTLTHADKQVNTLQIRPDKNYIAAGGNPSIRIYDINAKNSEPYITYEGHTGAITCLGFQREGRWMYSAGEEGTVRIWDLRVATSQRVYECDAGVNSVALHPNQGELVSGDQCGGVKVWDLTANKCSNEFAPESDVPISSIAVAADASMCVAANYNGNCYFWQPRSAEEYTPIKKLQAHKAYILSTRISPDVRYLATASSDRTVKLWNTRDFSLAATLSGHSRWVWDCVFSADSSYLVTASSDSFAKLWEVSSGEVVRTYSGHAKAITAVALNDAPPAASLGAPTALPPPSTDSAKAPHAHTPGSALGEKAAPNPLDAEPVAEAAGGAGDKDT